MKRGASHGLALAELMVALAIGLILVLAAIALLMLARSTYLLTDDRARVEESGRFALEIISQAVRQAGYRDWSAAGAAEAGWPAVSGLDARSLKEASDGIAGPWPAAVNDSDVLALRFDGGDSGSSSGDLPLKSCAGAGVPALGSGSGWSIFYVAGDSAGEPELRCKYRTAGGWHAEAMVRGVEGFQVLYQLDGAAPSGLLDAGAVAQQPAGWQRVSAVTVALLVRGSHAGDSGALIEEARLPAASRRLLRRVYSATIRLRNQPRSGA